MAATVVEAGPEAASDPPVEAVAGTATSDMEEYVAELFLPCGNRLGESPRWDEAHGTLCWLDIDGKVFWRCSPEAAGLEEAERFELPARAGCFCMTDGGEYIFAFEDGFAFFDLDTGRRLKITSNFEPGLRTRLNDGRVDCEGRFVVGGHVEKGNEPLTGVYRLNVDLSVECLCQGVRCSNSICFSADDGAMFFTDTMMPSPEIWRFPDYAVSGMQGNREVFARPEGKPDGSIIDSEGLLWNAEFGGGRVVCYGRDGAVVAVVRAPVRYTTCAAFGDADLRTLYITDASVSRLSKKRLAEYSPGHPGGLFRVRLPHAGLPERRFQGSSTALSGSGAEQAMDPGGSHRSETQVPEERRMGS